MIDEISSVIGGIGTAQTMTEGLKDKARSLPSALFQHPGDIWRGLQKSMTPGFRGFAHGTNIGWKMGFKGGSLFVIGGAAYAAATAPRGQAISKSVSAGIGFGITSLIGGAIGGALGGVPGAYIGSLAAQYLGADTIDKAIAGVIQPMVDFGSNMRKARFGGDYRDTQTAVTMRQAAAREMSRSLVNARQWLGQEGAFMHQ